MLPCFRANINIGATCQWAPSVQTAAQPDEMAAAGAAGHRGQGHPGVAAHENVSTRQSFEGVAVTGITQCSQAMSDERFKQQQGVATDRTQALKNFSRLQVNRLGSGSFGSCYLVLRDGTQMVIKVRTRAHCVVLPNSQSCKVLLSYRSGCNSVAYAASDRMGYRYVGLPAACSCSQMRSISSLQDIEIHLGQSARADPLFMLRSARMEVCLGKAWSCAYIPRVYHGAVTSCELNHQETHKAACFDEVNAALYEGRLPAPEITKVTFTLAMEHAAGGAPKTHTCTAISPEVGTSMCLRTHRRIRHRSYY